MLRMWLIGIWRWFLKVTRRFTIAIGLVCIIEWLFFIVLVEVVAMRIDHTHMAPTFGHPILDASLHCNLHYLQHSCNHTHSQSENS
ncbi:hypothetical protein AHAS_Ahas08G0046100 [Arachis hypogaea]